MDEDALYKELCDKVAELHQLWWESVWSEFAFYEFQGKLPDDFTFEDIWANFNEKAKDLYKAGFDIEIMITEFEERGAPIKVIAVDYITIAEKAKCVS
jgi:hypothetical protein